jgi:two-component system nitrate/nitrite sensor histidine kinase NarX
VRDNGRGFDPAPEGAVDTRVGLHIMKERAERIGAQVMVESCLGQGTEVTIDVAP